MRERVRRSAAMATMMVLVAATACASNPRPGSFSRFIITGSEVREAGYGSAYEALTHHRDLIVFEDQIGFKGGNDSAGLFGGRQTQAYYVPLLVVDGDFSQNDTITTLRRIPADVIVAIRLYTQSMVPPRYRRPGAEGGVIEVSTR